jgi:hypothetical protein
MYDTLIVISLHVAIRMRSCQSSTISVRTFCMISLEPIATSCASSARLTLVDLSHQIPISLTIITFVRRFPINEDNQRNDKCERLTIQAKRERYQYQARYTLNITVIHETLLHLYTFIHNHFFVSYLFPKYCTLHRTNGLDLTRCNN